jgi:hypothetical protein
LLLLLRRRGRESRGQEEKLLTKDVAYKRLLLIPGEQWREKAVLRGESSEEKPSGKEKTEPVHPELPS